MINMSWKDILRKEEPRTVLVYVTIHPVDEQVNAAFENQMEVPHIGWNQDYLEERIEQTEQAYNEYKNKIQPELEKEKRMFKEDAYAALKDWGLDDLQPENMNKLQETGIYYRIDAWGWDNEIVVIYDEKTDKFDKEAFIEGSFPQRGDHF